MSDVFVPQYLVALQRANDTRLQISELRRDLKQRTPTGARAEVARLLRGPDVVQELWSGMPVETLLLAMRGHGRHKVRPLIENAGIVNPRKRVDCLTGRQREALARQLTH